MATSVSMQSPIPNYANFGAQVSQNVNAARERALKDTLNQIEKFTYKILILTGALTCPSFFIHHPGRQRRVHYSEVLEEFKKEILSDYFKVPTLAEQNI